MKKSICAVFGVLFLFNTAFAMEDLLSFSAGISSGIPVYGTNSLSNKIDFIENKHRVIIGSLFTINLNPYQQITFFTGGDILSDFNWNSDSEYAHCLHISFPLGVKIYPNLAGFNLGIAYALGFRADLSKTKGVGKDNNIAAWSNGFKFSAEYNFAHCGQSKFYPSIGLSWNLMPRGKKSYDNIFTFYVAENF